MDKRIAKNIIKLVCGLSLIVLVWWLLRCQCVDLKAFTPAAIRDYIQGFGRLGPVVYILAYALNTVSIVPPIATLSLVAGVAFGKFWGALYLMSGALLGTTLTFWISRFFGRGLVIKFFRGRFQNLDRSLAQKGFLTVIFFRVVPIIPYEVLNYASGLSNIRFKDYFLATCLGLMPGVAVAVFFGETLAELDSWREVFSLKFVLALVLLILMILIPIIYQYLKKKQGASYGA